MAKALLEETVNVESSSVLVGKQILEIITSGMYSDPLMAIREYVQNACDSLDVTDEGTLHTSQRDLINIAVDGRDRRLVIEDNGLGIPASATELKLRSLGCSTKNRLVQRGFRGIGRLGGLAYCDLLRFETRSSSSEPVSICEWDGRALRQDLEKTTRSEAVQDAINRITRFQFREARPGIDPAHFFRVSLVNVSRFHSDKLMNVKMIRDYLSQIAPVPHDPSFVYSESIMEHVAAIPNVRSYNIHVNGIKLHRPYSVVIPQTNKSRSDSIHSIKFFELVSRNGVLLARGWHANSSFLASLPSSVLMRGIRVRQGNIEVGNEHFLREFFAEPRFATWHIGEIHTSPRLKLNARRDGFEETPEYEELLEQMHILGHQLSRLCRSSSKARSRHQTAFNRLEELEHQLDQAIFINKDQVTRFLADAAQTIANCRSLEGSASLDRNRLAHLERRCRRFQKHPITLDDLIDGRSMRYMRKKDLVRVLCESVLKAYPKANTAECLLYNVLRQFSRKAEVAE